MSLQSSSKLFQIKNNFYNFSFPFFKKIAISKNGRKFIAIIERCCCCNVIKAIISVARRFLASHKRKQDEAVKIRFVKSRNAISHCHKIKTYVPKRMASGSTMRVNVNLFSSIESLKRKHLISTKSVAVRAAKLGIPKVKKLNIPDIGILVAKRFDQNKIIDHEILPTSHIRAMPRSPDIDHLANTFSLIVSGKERAIIRSARIDSHQKAKDFTLLLLAIKKEIARTNGDKNFRLRVFSNQLNSFEIESNLIVHQHRYLALVNKKLAHHKIEILHINTPTVRFYDLAKSAKKLRFFNNPIQRVVFRNSEKKSREQNLESWAGYFGWIADSYVHLNQLCSDMKKNVKKINDWHIAAIKVSRQLKLSKSSKALMTEKKIIFRNIKELRQSLKDQLLLGIKKLKTEMAKCPKSSSEYRKLNLFTKILDSQLSVRGRVLERGHEQMLIHLLNTEMKVTASVNCRSGLDRTGFLHGVMTSLETAVKYLGAERVHNIAEDWTNLTSRLNLASLTKIRTRDFLKNISKDIADKVKDINEFRKIFLTHLLRIGLPITTLNTGYMGFKWQSGVYFNIVENRIPLNFLPPSVIIAKKSRKFRIRLVTYSKKTGKPLGLTEMGRQLLIKFAEMRGP